ncbi:hypothetical protein [Hymenobacter cellulosilyticus]|uniref:Uncharacterized protein n=1 Tax=Hymenobacter cellulosilyticus TaxID=2932248 RepID=A0A8T9Q071_9BACT|nr:hypothetical protein [Hymenobacter cellulosilyticus]UOQ70757.1 hypothetical protein MUN79_18950 [Hymenobacter cellulosilyticus]
MPAPTVTVKKAWTRIVLAVGLCCLFYSLMPFIRSADVSLLLFLLFIVAGLVTAALLVRAIPASIVAKVPPTLLQLGALATALSAAVLLHLYHQGSFYGREILSARFKDDFSYLDLQLFENGRYIMTSTYIVGEDTYSGTYQKTDTTITFEHFPVIHNDFISQTVRLKGNRIYFRPDYRDSSYYHFTIEHQ